MRSISTVLVICATVSGCLIGPHLAPPSGKTSEPRAAASSMEPSAFGSGFAAQRRPEQVVATSLLPADELGAFVLEGKKERVTLTAVAAREQVFQKAVRAEITGPAGGENWEVQIAANTTIAVDKGDAILATFYVRSITPMNESGEAQTQFVFERLGEPWTKSVEYSIVFGSEWTKVDARFVAAESYDAGRAHVIFRLGYPAEAIELGGVTVKSYGKKLAVTDLPTTHLSYRGQEADAPWRKAAAERIEKHRKGDLVVTVNDASGRPVANADVSVDLARGAFKLGSAVVAQKLLSSGEEAYRKNITDLFNFAVLENDLKWQSLAGDWGGGWGLDQAKKAVTWLRSKGIGVRGHVLVWPSWRNLPKYLYAYKDDKPRLRDEVDRHVRELAGAMKGQLSHWDVVNEPFDNHDLMDIFGPEEMVRWFQIARQADPDVKLFLNDFGILAGGGGTTPHRDHFEKTIAFLIDHGAPIDGLGMQGHMGTVLTAPEDLLKTLDRFARFGKTIFVTEYDVPVDDEFTAGEYTRDFYTTLFSHPAVGGIVMWGFADDSVWGGGAPIFRKDGTLKPAGAAYKELALARWQTHEKKRTDASGVVTVRGFLGEYDIVATADGKKALAHAVLAAGGAKLVLTLR
jgi:endo-1,4-beta-xylanase